MSKNKITRWIDLQSKRISYAFAKKIYPKLESGKPTKYIFKLKFLHFYIGRGALLLLNFFRFNKSLYKPYIDILKLSSNSKFKKLLVQFSGIKSLEYKEVFNGNINPNLIKLKRSENPIVSIVIPVYNQITYTLNLLFSISKNIKNIEYELIIVDDYSVDETNAILTKIPNVNYIRNNSNQGFLISSDLGAKNAKGKYVCFLNNDTYVLENWLESLVQTISKDEMIGLVGSKLLYSYGLLQEAGGIIYSDGSGCNYGKFSNPESPQYNYARETDYCSGASILMRKDDYIHLNGFDKRYIPAYYEDTDLCFAIRHILNKKVLYQPLSQLIHFEGISSGKSPKNGNVKSYQDVNRIKFVEKWGNILEQKNSIKSLEAANKYQKKKEIVVIDSYLPFHDKESGSNRIFNLIKIFQSLSLHVVFIPKDGVKVDPYYSELTYLGVEVIIKNLGKSEFRKSILNRARAADYVWICRPEVNKKFKKIFDIQSPPIWIYDTIDLHYVRLKRALELYPNDPKLKKKINKIKELELSIARQADITICITSVEKEELKSEAINSTTVIPNIHDLKIKKHLKFEQREGLIFIGSFAHHPNEDGILWFINEIMPLVWRTNPAITVTLLGANPTPKILALNSEKVFVKGYIHDVSDYFEIARVFVAPLRYGAGMKGKIGHSMEFGLPVVTTNIGAEGMGLENEKNSIISNNSAEFADGIIRLYTNEELWLNIHHNSMEAIMPFTTDFVSKDISKLLKL